MDINYLVDFYNLNIKNKVFKTKLNHENKNIYFLFTYDYNDELDNFKNTFLYYLPYYVRSYDQLVTIDKDNILLELENRSKKIRFDKIMPKRKKEINGLYGELFLDFYLRIVCKKKSIITYAQKRAFNSNQEAFGPDNVVYYIDSNLINVCFCETKFVAGASTAKNNLLDDIRGKEGEPSHLTRDFLNDYIGFMVEKGPNIEESDKDMFKKFIDDLNRELDKNNNFVDIMIKHNIRFNFVFFAIFDSTKKKTIDFETYYSEIYNEAEQKVKDMGILNYYIEVVFIPTDNKPIDIKSNIEAAYHE